MVPGLTRTRAYLEQVRRRYLHVPSSFLRPYSILYNVAHRSLPNQFKYAMLPANSFKQKKRLEKGGGGAAELHDPDQ